MGYMDFKIPKGTPVSVGAPAKPMEAALVRSIAEIVKSLPEILEAHLPQLYVPGVMPQAAQVLIVVLPATVDSESVMRHLREGLARLTLPNHHLDIWPLFPDHCLLPSVRSSGCNVENAQTSQAPEIPRPRWRRWWKL